MTQNEYIEILANDIGLDTRLKRNGYISKRLSKEIKDLDDLSKMEKSLIINSMKDDKAAQK